MADNKGQNKQNGGHWNTSCKERLHSDSLQVCPEICRSQMLKIINNMLPKRNGRCRNATSDVRNVRTTRVLRVVWGLARSSQKRGREGGTNRGRTVGENSPS